MSHGTVSWRRHDLQQGCRIRGVGAHPPELQAVGVGGDFRYTSRLDRVEIYETDPRVAEKVLDLRVSAVWGAWTLRAQLANALNYIYSQVPRTLAPVRTFAATITWTY